MLDAKLREARFPVVALLQLSALFLFIVVESKRKNVIRLKLKYVWLFKYL